MATLRAELLDSLQGLLMRQRVEFVGEVKLLPALLNELVQMYLKGEL